MICCETAASRVKSAFPRGGASDPDGSISSIGSIGSISSIGSIGVLGFDSSAGRQV